MATTSSSSSTSTTTEFIDTVAGQTTLWTCVTLGCLLLIAGVTFITIYCCYRMGQRSVKPNLYAGRPVYHMEPRMPPPIQLATSSVSKSMVTKQTKSSEEDDVGMPKVRIVHHKSRTSDDREEEEDSPAPKELPWPLHNQPSMTCPVHGPWPDHCPFHHHCAEPFPLMVPPPPAYCTQPIASYLTPASTSTVNPNQQQLLKATAPLQTPLPQVENSSITTQQPIKSIFRNKTTSREGDEMVRSGGGAEMAGIDGDTNVIHLSNPRQRSSPMIEEVVIDGSKVNIFQRRNKDNTDDL